MAEMHYPEDLDTPEKRHAWDVLWGRLPFYVTEDDVMVFQGERAYNYYEMKPGVVGKPSFFKEWFEFIHDDGTVTSLNGQRICSVAYARRRKFRDA